MGTSCTISQGGMCMSTQTEQGTVRRDYKSTMFTMIFSDKRELLKLYNAVGQRNYDNPELLEINTLENVIYMSMKNDLSFLIDECIRENILREFLEKNRAEARSMSIYEYNEEEHMRMEREEAFEDGRKAEQANTEKERQRADAAETRVTEVETENKKLREEIARLKGLE